MSATSGPYAGTGTSTSTGTSTLTRSNDSTGSGSNGNGSDGNGSESDNTGPSSDAAQEGGRPGTLSSIVRPDDDSDAGTGSGSNTDSDGGSQATKVGFALVEPILKKSCTSCHGPGGELPDLSTYEKASSAGDRIVRSSASDVPSMPKGTKLTDSEKGTLRAWKDGGYAK